ncbi:MAG: hypothetical protein Kapaf2KO_09660 [Candidatus Kapaibacteriales bacterium]
MNRSRNDNTRKGNSSRQAKSGQTPKRRIKVNTTGRDKASAPRERKIDESQKVRINKYIADSGLCSRRKADELIAAGQVRVNGKQITELGTKIRPSDNVTVGGDPISYRRKNIYILLNKPKNTISTASDERGRKTVLEGIKTQERIYPVGRLDRNTTGSLIITNDGELANRLMHPSYRVERMYIVGLDKPLDVEDARKIANGVELEDGKTAPCHLLIDPKEKTRIEMTMTEGKNHEVKRIFAHFGYEVLKLDRKVFAGISNKGLDRGEYRHLNFKEVQALKKLVKLI